MIKHEGNIPAKYKEVASKDSRHVVAHSETGHHHWVDSSMAQLFTDPGDPMVCYLRVEGEADLTHARPYDTHKTLTLTKGTWQLRRQREYTPQGWRRVED